MIFKLFREGLTYAAIASKVGLSRQRVQQIVRPPKPIYDAVKAKADGKCEECGVVVSNGHIHHANGAGENFNDMENLQYLCPGCHRKAHSNSSMMLRTTIWLTREQAKRLQALAKKKGLKAAQLIRLYVDAGLKKEQ